MNASLGNGLLQKWIPPLVSWGRIRGWPARAGVGVRLRVNKGIPLLGLGVGRVACSCLKISSLLPGTFWKYCTSSRGSCSSRWRCHPEPFPWWPESVSQLGGLEEPGRAPQILHLLKRVMNLLSQLAEAVPARQQNCPR